MICDLRDQVLVFFIGQELDPLADTFKNIVSRLAGLSLYGYQLYNQGESSDNTAPAYDKSNIWLGLFIYTRGFQG